MTDSGNIYDENNFDEAYKKALIKNMCQNLDIHLLEKIKHWDFSKENKFELLKMLLFCRKQEEIDSFFEKFINILKPSEEEFDSIYSEFCGAVSIPVNKPPSVHMWSVLYDYRTKIKKEKEHKKQTEEQVNETSKNSEEKSTEEKQTDKTSENEKRFDQVSIDMMFLFVCEYSSNPDSLNKLFKFGKPSKIADCLMILNKRCIDIVEKFSEIIFSHITLKDDEIKQFLNYLARLNDSVQHNQAQKKKVFIDKMVKSI